MTNAPPDHFGHFRPSEMRPPEPQHQLPRTDHQPSRRSAAHARRDFTPPPKRSWLIALAMVAIGILLLGATGLALLTYVVAPANLVRATLIEQVKAQTGRELKISGGASLGISPQLSVTLHDVALSPPPGMSGRPTLHAASLQTSISLFGLLSGRVEIGAIELVRPAFDIRTDANGRRSWDFASPYPQRRVRYAAKGVAPPSARNLDHLDRLAWQRIVIRDGVLNYTDERTGARERTTSINATVGPGDFRKPVDLHGDVVWNGLRTSVRAEVDALRNLIAGESAKLKISMSSPLVTARFQGTAKLGERFELKGETGLASASFAALLRWMGTDFPNADPLGALDVAGFIAIDRASVSLGGAKLALGPTRAEGSIGLRLNSARPFVSADLRVTELDTDRLAALLSGVRAVPRATPAGLRPTVTGTPSTSKPRSIEDILQREGGTPGGGSVGRFSPMPAGKPPQVKGYQSRAGWSTAPIVATILGAADINARFSVAGLKASGLAAKRAVARLSVTNGRARFDIDDIELYGGRGTGIVTAAPAPGGVILALSITANDVTASPLLTDLAGFSRISGTGQLTANLTGTGPSQAAIMSSLSGKATLSLKDGAVAGWDVSAMVAGLKQGRLPTAEVDPNQKTPFGQFTADFKVDAGIAKTTNLTLTSPALRVAGAGTVDLGRRTVDMLMKPSFVDAAAAQVAGVSLAGLQLPFRIRGNWERPSINLEAGKILGDDKRLQQTFRDIRQRYKGKAPEEVVRDVLGRDGSGLKKALQGLFR